MKRDAARKLSSVIYQNRNLVPCDFSPLFMFDFIMDTVRDVFIILYFHIDIYHSV